MEIKKIFKDKKIGTSIVEGWVLSNRGNNKIRFVSINDGSSFDKLQIILKGELAEKFDDIKIGSAVRSKGEIVLTNKKEQPLEMVSSEFTLLKQSDDDFQLQKNEISREVLRQIPHLRHRTNLFRAVMRIRSTLTQEIHIFFTKKNFLNVASPILTGNDGEGAGEAFVADSEEEDHFFGKKATLGVTGQLHAEAYANGFGKVYTFAPTFRAENSHTTRHAAEFWMIEPEIAFKDKEYAIGLLDEMLKTVIKKTMDKHPKEFEFLEQKVSSGNISNLNLFLTREVKIITYRDAIKLLDEHKKEFKNEISFGLDLSTEHEKFLTDEIFKSPVVVVDYPSKIKAFYMKENQDKETVGAFDFLVPGIGELAGGSERETDYNKLEKKVIDNKMNKDDIQWYLDLRRFGQFKSVGFGVGFERLVMYVTGVDNIRDSIPFPRTPNNMKF